MNRMPVILTAALLALAPLSAAAAQDGSRGDRDRRPPGREQSQRPERSERPQMSSAEAQRIAQSRAGDARFVGYRGMSGNSYVFAFERDGRIFNVAVDASR
ncbi:hypothetical protein [Brevundimonas sp. FT23028]|uniref:hypothetical protein n=1 Tax=Brevundimonas sp. FT23028 TaxID=3393748 RepID=UPI003B588D48